MSDNILQLPPRNVEAICPRCGGPWFTSAPPDPKYMCIKCTDAPKDRVFEVLRKDIVEPRLTIAPDRTTLKILKSYPKDLEEELVKQAHRIENTILFNPELLHIIWRGRITFCGTTRLMNNRQTVRASFDPEGALTSLVVK